MKKNTKTKKAINTKVDDMMLEMIAPKVREIEEKFSRGEGLTQEDINTLLLKSQYNHINHLDLKLTEVTNSVLALESKFQILRSDFEVLKSDIQASISKSINRSTFNVFLLLGGFYALIKLIETFA